MSTYDPEAFFAELRYLLSASNLSAPEREARISETMQRLFDILPTLPHDEQQDIGDALYRLGLLPDRRTGTDRRHGEDEQTTAIHRERRSGVDRRRRIRNWRRWLHTHK